MLKTILPVLLIHLLAVVSPGPDFAMVVKNSLIHGRWNGIMTAMGITIGILVHLAYSFLGIGFIIAQSIFLFSIVKYCGAAYLLWIGIQALRSSSSTGQQTVGQSVVLQPISAMKAFREGFLTNLLNPKATLFFLGIFSQFMTPETPVQWYIAVTAGIVFNQFWWFSLVALVFSLPALQNRLQHVRKWLDRGMGIVLIALGFKVIFSSQGK